MATTTTKREKLQQKIDALTQQLQQLEQPSQQLTRKSEGVPEVIAAFDAAVKINKTTPVELFELLLKAKRTGLTLIKKDAV
ncbi:hypothetical protein [Methylobacillus glycogenes]|uniref:hypothetical protein n=1 Tax=Methylobacillus glycogenes TaxID=406 RepID=UPI000472ECA3|nr:hypothetical protein [Methylobacillus glycogenes]MBL8504837.1 hypothetical protein [Methylobacillus glycogenes]